MTKASVIGSGSSAQIGRIALEKLGWQVEIEASNPQPTRATTIEITPDFLAFLGKFLGEDICPTLNLRPLKAGLVRWGANSSWARRSKTTFSLDTAALERVLASRKGVPSSRAHGGGRGELSPAPRLEAAPILDSGESPGTYTLFAVQYESEPTLHDLGTLMEADVEGWTYVLPTPTAGRAFVTIMRRSGPETSCEAIRDSLNRTLMAKTLLREQIGRAFCVAAVPGFLRQTDTNGRFRIGQALMRLSPLCSGGVDASAKSAVLSAVAASQISDGDAPAALESHVRRRTLDFYSGHLRHLAELYEQAGLEVSDLRREQDVTRAMLENEKEKPSLCLKTLELTKA